MNLEQLNLSSFRNYDQLSLSFHPSSIHFLYGKNAQGKTNLIEAIYYLSYLRSFRTNQLNSLIKNDHQNFYLNALIESHDRKENIKVVVNDKKKYLYHFDDPVYKYSDFVGILNAILFCPDDLMLFNQSPKYRRRFIDMEMIKISRSYTATLSHAQKLLKQRNVALKKHPLDETLTSIYLDQLIDDEVIIIRQRSQFICSLMNYAKRFYPYFSNEAIDARYDTFVDIDDDLKEKIRIAHDKVFEKEKLYQQTLVGIHRDDICFLLNGKPVNEVCSQGQKRSFLLALKLGLTQMIYEKTRQYPVLLLDDVFSELDHERRTNLLKVLPEHMQIFITMTDRSNINMKRSYYFYEVEQGKIKEVAK